MTARLGTFEDCHSRSTADFVSKEKGAWSELDCLSHCSRLPARFTRFEKLGRRSRGMCVDVDVDQSTFNEHAICYFGASA